MTTLILAASLLVSAEPLVMVRSKAAPKTAACDCRPVCDCDGCACKGRPTPKVDPPKVSAPAYTFAPGHPQPGFSYEVRAGVAVPISRQGILDNSIRSTVSSCPGGVCPLPRR